jgi:hypothetical protein
MISKLNFFMSYRSDEALYSERTDEKIKFRNHTIKPESMILTPQHISKLNFFICTFAI